MDNLIKAFGLDKLIMEAGNTLPQELNDFPLAIYATNCDGDILYYNRRAVLLWRRVPVKGRDKWCADYDLYTKEGQFIPREKCAMAMAAKQGRTLRGIEAVAARPDGTAFRFLPFPTPLYSETGELVGAVNMIVDLGEVDMRIPLHEIEFQHASV